MSATTASESLRSLLAPSPTIMNGSPSAAGASAASIASANSTSTTTTNSTTNGTPTLVKRDYTDNETQQPQQQQQQSSSGDSTNNNHARKRSKVSRACDPCRRKKIRCNAEYSSSLQRVTKICTNCVKNCEECTFSRVPLKRGPSKGFVRDHDEYKPEGKDINMVPPNVVPIGPPPLGATQPLPFPQPLNSNSAPIKLPPIVGYQAKPLVPPTIQKLNSSSSIPGTAGSNSNPSSPRTYQLNGILNAPSEGYSSTSTLTATTAPTTTGPATAAASTIGTTNSPPIQGPFWKVPYEMPNSDSSRRSSSSISLANGGTNNRRRSSSIDSISSISTNGSRLPSLKPTISVNSDFISDSDSEDFYSIKSSSTTPFKRDSQASLSPRNSVTSLSSLNGRMTKGLYLSTPPNMVGSPASASPAYSPYYSHQPYPPPAQPHGPVQYPVVVGPPQHIQPVTNFQQPPPYQTPLNPLDINLRLYYQHCHSSFPILPFNPNYLLNLAQNRDESGPQPWILDLFNHALNNLNNFKQSNDHVEFFTRLMQIYPFGSYMNDNSLVFWFSTLLIANYSILLNGDVYSMGISWTCSILNDFKVLEKFIEFVEKSQSSDYDNITLYFAKLYYSLDLIDDIYCLGMGTQKSINQNTLIQFLHANIRFFVKEDESIKSGMALFKNAPLLIHMINVRDQYIYEGKYSKPIPIQQQTSDDQFAAHFMTLVSEKYDLINYLLEINHFIVHDSNKHHDSDELYETLMDYNLKLIRLVKKLSSSIMNFANFIGTSTTGSAAATTATTSSPTSPSLKPSLVNPLLNISIGQLFKLIKLIKLIIDSLTTSKQSSTDLENRLTKINNDLSISFNLLNLNLVNLQLGTKSSLIIKKKVGDYKFNFNKPTNITTTEQSLNSYIQEFTNTILPFIQQENRHGWY